MRLRSFSSNQSEYSASSDFRNSPIVSISLRFRGYLSPLESPKPIAKGPWHESLLDRRFGRAIHTFRFLHTLRIWPQARDARSTAGLRHGLRRQFFHLLHLQQMMIVSTQIYLSRLALARRGAPEVQNHLVVHETQSKLDLRPKSHFGPGTELAYTEFRCIYRSDVDRSRIQCERAFK